MPEIKKNGCFRGNTVLVFVKLYLKGVFEAARYTCFVFITNFH